jgi:hypothetical protein
MAEMLAACDSTNVQLLWRAPCPASALRLLAQHLRQLPAFRSIKYASKTAYRAAAPALGNGSIHQQAIDIG